jgi:hypothetical protein
MSIVGIQRRMLGIKISIFDVEECGENGVFFPATQSDWDLRSIEKSSRIKASVDNIPFSEYFLMQVFADPMLLKVPNPCQI